MQADDTSRSTPTRILIVEDNELNLLLLKDVLEFHGYTIVSTRLGATVLTLARQHHPHLILMDIQLPDISGIDAARQLKADEETRSIPIIAVTAFAMPGDKSKILESGIEGYIAKPYKIQEMLNIVAEYLKQRSAPSP
jgi:two-component system cell cycle response regulator DivK